MLSQYDEAIASVTTIALMIVGWVTLVELVAVLHISLSTKAVSIDNVTVDGIKVAVVSNSGDAKTSKLRVLAHDLAVQAAGSSVPISYDLFVLGSGTLGIEAQ